MSHRPRCSFDLLISYVAGTASDDERAFFERHMEQCQNCRRDVKWVTPPTQVDREEPVSPEVARQLKEAEQQTRDEEEVGKALFLSLLSASPDTWRDTVCGDRRFCRAGVVRLAIAVAQDTFWQLPSRAKEIAALAADIAEMLPTTVEVLKLRALAYIKLSTGHAGVGEYKEAMGATLLAESCIEGWPSSDHDLANVFYARAVILRRMGHAQEAVELLSSAKETFRVYGDAKRLADTLYTEGALLYDSGSFRDALGVFEEVAERMRALGQRDMEATTYFAIGRCHDAAGDDAAAIANWAKAKVIYQRCGMAGEMIRLSTAIARKKLRVGDVDEALDLLRAAERDFEEMAMRDHAIDVSLEIVIALVDRSLNGDEVLSRCREIVPKAAAAGMSDQVMIALAYVRKAANDGWLDADLVRNVRQFISDSKAYPQMEFRLARRASG